MIYWKSKTHTGASFSRLMGLSLDCRYPKLHSQIHVKAAPSVCVCVCLYDMGCMHSSPPYPPFKTPSDPLCRGCFPLILALGPTWPLSTHPSCTNGDAVRSVVVQDTHTLVNPPPICVRGSLHRTISLSIFAGSLWTCPQLRKELHSQGKTLLHCPLFFPVWRKPSHTVCVLLEVIFRIWRGIKTSKVDRECGWRQMWPLQRSCKLTHGFALSSESFEQTDIL